MLVGSWFCETANEYVVVIYETPIPGPAFAYGWIKTYPGEAATFADLARIGLLKQEIADRHNDFTVVGGRVIGMEVRHERPKKILWDWNLFPVAEQ